METPAFLVANRQAGVGMITPVRDVFLAIGIGLATVLTVRGEENSAQRLQSAQQGMAEESWPKKPDNRISPLSGKMKDTAKISPRFYGQDKEFPTRQLGEWQKESRLAAKARWEDKSSRGWEDTRWNQSREWSGAGEKNQKFQSVAEPAEMDSFSSREIEKVTMSGWSSRASRLAGTPDGTLRRYDGRLTRVRNQVWEESDSPRDLGPGRPERFRPEEVEKILSQPAGDFQGKARERSGGASPLAAADN